MQIEELEFSVRTYNCLKRAKVDTVDQLAIMSDEDLMRIRCFGQRCLAEVRAKIPVPRKTNADRIRAMSDEELAEIIMCPYGSEPDLCCTKGTCLDCCEQWLQEPAEEVPGNGL